MENSYVEVKVSFIHIVVMLAGVILIGAILFYLGYQAGKSSTRNELLGPDAITGTGKSEEIQLVDGEDKKKTQQAQKKQDPSISEEIKLHQLPSTEKKKEKIEAKPVQREAYWTVQVGAFSDYTNAKNYSAKFADMGYQTEINTIVRDNIKLHRVRVGNFKTRAEARRERKKLEQMENKKFNIVRVS
jgi:cell division septation protein DedD